MINDIVKTNAPETANISVYQVGDAVVHERRLVKLEAGKTQILVNGLPVNFVEDSFQVCSVHGPAELKLGSDSFSPAELSVEALLQKSISSQITVQENTSDGVTTYSGTLRFVFGNQVALQTEDGVQLLQLGSRFKLASMPANLRETPTLCLEANATTNGDYTLHSLYETGGLSWSAMYSLFYDAAAGKLKTLQCRVKLSNLSGAKFENVLFHLMTGTNSSRARVAPQQRGLESAKYALASSVSPSALASVESLGDQKMYTLPEALSIEHGQTKRPYLIVKRDIPVRSEYFVDASNYGSVEPSKHSVRVRLRVDNTAENNLGVDLPAGEAAVFQTDTLGNAQKTEHSLSIEQLAAGEELCVEFNTPCSEIKASRQLLSSKEDPETQEEASGEGEQPKAPRYRVEERKLELSNYKDENVCVLVQEELPGCEFEILHSDQRFAEQNLHKGVFVVEVPGNGSRTVTYALKWRVN